MRVLSLFSGGGLGDYGLELAGMTIVAQCEIDEYCQKILKRRWPDVPKWKDITATTAESIIKQCGEIDVISGGFPCQDISVVGKVRRKPPFDCPKCHGKQCVVVEFGGENLWCKKCGIRWE